MSATLSHSTHVQASQSLIPHRSDPPPPTYIQPPDCFLDVKRCVPSCPDFKAPRCFAGSTAIDFSLLRGPAGLPLRVEGLRCRGSWSGGATLRFAILRLARSFLYTFRCLVL